MENTEQNKNTWTNLSEGEFGPIYVQFEGKPKKAIRHLRKMKKGECPGALHRTDIGKIDIVWGEVTDPEMFRVIIQKQWNGKKKTFLLSTFDLRKKPK